ncbi:MAG: lyase [SAR324 cluster bacterium]|nr:lyase [SAR324 cluster bacterium]
MHSKKAAVTRLGISIAIFICLSISGLPAADTMNPIKIEEWEVPYGGRARDPFAVSEDEIWFVGQSGNYLARFTPSTGTFFKRDLPDSPGPHNLIVDSDGIVWYAGNRKGYIGRYNPASGKIETIEMPDSGARDPHTLVFDEGERHIWFTVRGGNFVGRLNIAGRTVDLIEVPTSWASPYGIKMAPDGTPWIVLLGTNKLASVDPGTLKLTEYVIPAGDARPRRLEVTRDGRIWYADYRRGYLGRYDPKARSFREWALPSGERSRPYGMALDEHGRIWVVETGVSPNFFVGFDTRTERVFSVTPIPSGAGAVRHMDYHAGSGAVWFGTDRNTLGRALVKRE